MAEKFELHEAAKKVISTPYLSRFEELQDDFLNLLLSKSGELGTLLAQRDEDGRTVEDIFLRNRKLSFDPNVFPQFQRYDWHGGLAHLVKFLAEHEEMDRVIIDVYRSSAYHAMPIPKVKDFKL